MSEQVQQLISCAKDKAAFYQAEALGHSAKAKNSLQAMLKVWKCRLQAFFWLTALLWSAPLTILATLALWLKLKLRNEIALPQFLPENERKTVLITGAPLTKALQIARIMGQAGHRVIVADKDPADGLSFTRFSQYVHKFVNLEARSKADYVEGLVRLWASENVDWFLPVSHINLAVEDTEAKERMEAGARKFGRIFNSLALTSVQMAEALDDKLTFLNDCKELDLKVPDFRQLSTAPNLISDLRQFRDQGLFHDRHFFLKPLELQRDERLDLTRIPSDEAEFEAFLKGHVGKKDLSVPYVLNEFIDGKEFAANVICKDGHILMLQICPSSPIQISYRVADHSGIRKWVTEFVRAKNITGMICFDFMVDKLTNVAYCIECNPRLHSAIVNFSDDKQRAELEKVIRCALLNNDFVDQPVSAKSTREIYWLFNECFDLVTGAKSLDSFIDTLQHGQDAIWKPDDPLPFLALIYVQIPYLLVKATLQGKKWNKVNFCLGQVL